MRKTVKLSNKGKLILLCIFAVVALINWLMPAQPPPHAVSLQDVPAFSGEPYVVIGENLPLFDEEDMTAVSYEFYSELDDLGRCGYTMACIGKDLMPTEDRESISQVKPTGW